MSSTKREFPPRKVFLSYSSEDDDAAAAIKQSLSERGAEVWSSQDIMPGDNIAASIQREINQADDVLILMSPSSQASPWVEYEAAAALAAREAGEWKRIIPVLLASNVELPLVLQRFNYLDLSSPERWPEGLDRLASAVELDEPRMGRIEEGRLEWQKLEAERLALSRAKMEHEVRALKREGALRHALGLAAVASLVALLLLVILGSFGGLASSLAGALGVLIGALASSVLTVVFSRRGWDN